MKITFTCPDCGTLIQESEIAMTEYSGHWGFEDVLTCPKCPKCAKLTYGALTEGMMAEALRVARDSAPGCGLRELAAGPAAQARFVLRLLNDGEFTHAARWPHANFHPESWSERLLDLARQP